SERYRGNVDVVEEWFFFRAEGGIRDGHVTGVQTCALPISTKTALVLGRRGSAALTAVTGAVFVAAAFAASASWQLLLAGAGAMEIGRASCRERVYNSMADENCEN